MPHQVRINANMTTSGITETQWQEIITADTRRGARSRATRFINRELFFSDFTAIDREEFTPHTDCWTISLYNWEERQ